MASTLSTGFSLPFPVAYTPGVLTADRPAYLRVRYGDPKGAAHIAAAVQAFTRLAASGALCGASVDPAVSTLALRPDQAVPGDSSWSIERALLADEALVVLTHLIYRAHPSADVTALDIVARSIAVAPQWLARDTQLDSTYPAAHAAPGYAIEGDGLQTDAYAFEIELAQPLAPHSQRWLDAMLAAWARAVELGGFAMPPVAPWRCYVEPDERVTAYARSVEWAFFKLRADEACIDTLYNGLTAFHARCQPIVRVRVE